MKNKTYEKIAEVYIKNKINTIYLYRQNNSLFIINAKDLHTIDYCLKNFLFYEKVKTIENAINFINNFFDSIAKIYPISFCKQCKKVFNRNYLEPYVSEFQIEVCEECYNKNTDDEDNFDVELPY